MDNPICKTICAHPGATAAVMGVLLILIIVLVFAVAHYKAAASKDTFAAGAAAPFPQVGPAQLCGRGWDPAASAEAQALATAGGLPHRGYAEPALRVAIDGAFDTKSSSLNDEQLTALMHNGDAM